MKDVTKIKNILKTKCKLLPAKSHPLDENGYWIHFTGETAIQLHVHSNKMHSVVKTLNKENVKAKIHTSKHGWRHCISIKNVSDTVINPPTNIREYVTNHTIIHIFSNEIWYNGMRNDTYKTIPIFRQIKDLIDDINIKYVIIPHRYCITVTPLSEHDNWIVNKIQWKDYNKSTELYEDYLKHGRDNEFRSEPIKPLTNEYNEPENIPNDSLIETVISTLNNKINNLTIDTTDISLANEFSVKTIIITNDAYNEQWMELDIKTTNKNIKKISDKIKKGQKKANAKLNDIKTPDQYVIKFGKYKGTKITDMTSSEQLQYCDYMIKQMYSKSEAERKLDAFYSALSWHKTNVMNSILYNEVDFIIDETKEVDPTGLTLNFGKFKGRSLDTMIEKEEINYLNWYVTITTEKIMKKETAVNNFFYAIRTAYTINKEIYDKAKEDQSKNIVTMKHRKSSTSISTNCNDIEWDDL